MNFYNGDCEICREYSSERDCYYVELGRELYLCPSCLEEIL